MIGVVNGRQIVALIIFRSRKAPEMCCHCFHIEDLDWPFVPRLLIFVPNMVKGNTVNLIAVITKRVDVAVANFTPVHELDPKLEAALDHRQHVALVDFEQTVEV